MNIPNLSTQAEVDALAPGTDFQWIDGQTYRKAGTAPIGAQPTYGPWIDLNKPPKRKSEAYQVAHDAYMGWTVADAKVAAWIVGIILLVLLLVVH